MAEPRLVRNPWSIAGAWLTTVSAIAFIAYYVADALNLLGSPYSGLGGFVALPALFVFGLLLIPFGIWREGRRRQRGSPAWRWPAIDLGRSTTRRILFAILALTFVNLAIIAVAGLGAKHYMETEEFCGQVCHVPMRPEFTAHKASPHAHVTCVACHVSPGAGGTLKAKMNGTRQLFLVATGDYERPIPVPARGLPVAAHTCERCHSSERMPTDVTWTKREYADDEANTETATTMIVHTGRIHWHARPDVQIEYVASDPKLDTIPYVKLTEPGGRVTEFFAADVTSRPAGAVRRMDCLDCHTRPAHTFSSSAESAVDRAIAAGDIDRRLRFVRREAVAALKTDYPGETAAVEGIRKRLTDFYKDADRALAPDLARSVSTVERLYRVNVFPEMKVTWGTYLSNLGHTDRAGCFRCHDESHTSKEGRAIRQDCELCHKMQ
jgi:nitrate/TMAO reductase-like tetraheme cytochrome c subunit